MPGTLERASTRFDAIIVGAALGGLASAAILAHRGWRVAVIDPLARPGSKVGGVEVDGWWIDWGHRDGHGSGDLAFIPGFTTRAAETAGVELHLRPFTGTSLRVHWLPEGRATELPADALIFGEGDAQARMRELCRFFGDVTEDLDAVAEETLSVWARLGAFDADEADRLIPVRMGDWLQRNVANPVVHRVILQQFECMPFTPAAETSVGRYAQFLQTVRGQAVIPDDPEVGGIAGVVAPFTRGLQRDGGEMWLGYKAVEIVTDEHQVTGVVVVNEANLVQLLEAPVVITDHPGWQLPELLDERMLPTGWLDAAKAVERYGSDGISWWAGLSRLPRRRSDGAVEDNSAPWQRILYGHNAIRECHGGFHFPSSFSSRSAPEGKHLLCVEMVASGEGGRRWRSFRDARQSIDMNLEYLRRYYSDLDECVEWSSYQYIAAPQYLSWYGKPVRRHPVAVSTIGGLYVASSSAETRGAWLDSECAAALAAIAQLEADRGAQPPARPGA